MCLSSPARTPKSQLAAEQAPTGEYWIPPKKDIPRPGAKENLRQDGRRGEIMFRIKLHTRQRRPEDSDKTLCAPGLKDPTRDRARPAFECLSVSCGGAGQQWPEAGTGALGAAELGGAACGINLLRGGLH